MRDMTENMRVLVFDHMAECTEAEVQRLLPLVSAQRREQALRYKHTFGQYCCLKSWEMLSSIFPRCDHDKTTCEWLYNEHGKPYFENGPYFSISHCKEGIAVAVSEEPIGIDIEGIRKVDEDLIERVMNTQEQAKITAAKEPEREFTRLWTQKEAIVKAQGSGIQSFEQMQTILNNGQWTLETFEKANYIYSIAYGKLHCFSAKVQTADL